MAPVQAIPGHASIVDPPEGEVDIAILPDHTIVARGSDRGRNSYSSTPDGDELRLFEPTTRKWQSAGSPALSAWEDSLTALTDGRVLLTGGVVVSSCPSGGGPPAAYVRSCGVVQTRVEIWNRATLSFQPAAPLSTGRFGHTSVLLADGRVLVVGGRSLPGSGNTGMETAAPVATAEIYDPARDRWTVAPPMRVARYYLSAIRLEDGRVLVVGDGSAEIFDPRTSTWTASASSPPWLRAVAISLGPSGTLIVGQVVGQATPRAAIFDGEVWSEAAGLELKSMPIATVRLRDPDPRVALVDTASVVTWDLERHTAVESPLAEVRNWGTAVVLPDGALLVLGGLVPPSGPTRARGVSYAPPASPEIWTPPARP
jgi:large repetitive protein